MAYRVGNQASSRDVGTRLFISAGLIPLPWFLLWVTIGGLLAPNYDPIGQHASELSLLGGAPRMLLAIAAIGSGLAFIAFGIGLWRESGRAIAFGALAWMAFGVSMISNGIWVMGSPMHGLYALGLASILAPAFSLLEMQRLRADRSLFVVTVLCSFGGLFYLWLNLMGFDAQPTHGLTQRVFSSLCSLWPAWAAWRFREAT
ncbi:DUF998 domain-containing protein [Sphingomonas crusticola]|uniref:DUF998 domain-containing protein n=1 Tax=Sphingomonas crusticola TaxID=1697973 RepID=UPI000E252DD2|nr:DUF998 domain-containing protein [Sphingomonas crusticola]